MFRSIVHRNHWDIHSIHQAQLKTAGTMLHFYRVLIHNQNCLMETISLTSFWMSAIWNHKTVCFVFDRASAPRHLLLGKGHPMRKLCISTGAFQGHQGNDHRAWRQSPSLPPRSIRPEIVWWINLHVHVCNSAQSTCKAVTPVCLGVV